MTTQDAALAADGVELRDAPPRLRILVIDDDKVDRISVRRSLRSAGLDVEVEESDGCADALSRLAARSYDCVFLDYLLPDGTGLSVIQSARQAGVRCPFVVLTGQGDETTAVELMKAGAADYMPKAQATSERIAQCLRATMRVVRAERDAMRADLERARALDLERRARDDAEAAQRRLAFLAEASTLLSSSLDYETTLQNVARLAIPALADWCFVDLLDAEGGFTRMAVAHGDPSMAGLAKRMRRRYAGMPEAAHGISRVMTTGRSEVMSTTPDWVLMELARDAEHLEILREIRPGSVMTVPLVARNRTLGAISFLAQRAGRYAPDDLSLAEELAGRAALAVDNARLYSEVRDAQEQLRRQLDFTGAITGSLAEGVCALDLEGRFTFVNAAAESILGHAPGTLLGRALADAILGSGAKPLLSAVGGGHVLRIDDATFQRSDGSPVAVSFVASPILNDGRPIGAVLAFHDITPRKEAERELEASRRQLAQSEKLSALGTLVSGVAHELRTPLTYLNNNIFLLQARLDGVAREDARLSPLVADVRRFAQAAMEGVDRINALVKDLRPFSNPEGGRRVRAGLDEVVGGAVDLFRATQRGRIEVVAELEPTPPMLLEKGQIQRVAINLLVNAAEAMPNGGRIRIRTRAEADTALLEVEDEGTGIPPEIEPRIFDPFFTTKADGTGLGLAITRRIAEAHGGAIGYQTSLGRGTTFRVRLPLDASPLAEPPVAAPATTP